MEENSVPLGAMDFNDILGDYYGFSFPFPCIITDCLKKKMRSVILANAQKRYMFTFKWPPLLYDIIIKCPQKEDQGGWLGQQNVGL